MSIDSIIAGVIATEGGYVNNPNDKGGETNFGITVAVARANGYTGPMKSMPKSVAESIYRKRYVVDPKFDQVAALSASVAEELIDTGVNMGPVKAAEFLQRWLNGFGVEGKDLVVDGKLGPASLTALKTFLQKRGTDGERVLLRGLNGSQAARYLDLTESNKTQRTFLYGWVKNRVS